MSLSTTQAAKYALDLENAAEDDPIFRAPVPDFRPGTTAARSRKYAPPPARKAFIHSSPAPARAET